MAGAWASFVKRADLSQTTYAGITRIRFKGTLRMQISAFRHPCFYVQLSVYRPAAKSQAPAGILAAAGSYFLARSRQGRHDRMNVEPERRAALLGEYIAEHSATVRAAARAFGCSKSTVHKDVSTRLRTVNPALFAQVQAVLARNKAERHLRGGAATRRKFQNK